MVFAMEFHRRPWSRLSHTCISYGCARSIVGTHQSFGGVVLLIEVRKGLLAKTEHRKISL